MLGNKIRIPKRASPTGYAVGALIPQYLDCRASSNDKCGRHDGTVIQIRLIDVDVGRVRNLVGSSDEPSRNAPKSFFASTGVIAGT